jgi:ferredoxin-type protein NapH
MKSTKSKRLRTIVSVVFLVVISAAYIAMQPVGTLSAIGWGSISLLCPLGALSQLLAAKLLVPRVVVALVIVLVLILLFGRAFCGWVCPVPLVSRLHGAFDTKDKRLEREKVEAAKYECGRTNLSRAAVGTDGQAVAAGKDEHVTSKNEPIELTEQDLKILMTAMRGHGTCASARNWDSRHIVLGGALLSTFIFGFPVFCLVCPIGLTFATVFVVFNLFAYADMTWTALVIPVLLLVEVVFFRKWCSHVCPVSALMSLVGKGNRTFVPAIDADKCLESSKHTSCGVCHKVCEQGIDPRYPQLGNNLSECTKCRACVDACPGGAISMPFISKSSADVGTPSPVEVSGGPDAT